MGKKRSEKREGTGMGKGETAPSVHPEHWKLFCVSPQE